MYTYRLIPLVLCQAFFPSKAHSGIISKILPSLGFSKRSLLFQLPCKVGTTANQTHVENQNINAL